MDLNERIRILRERHRADPAGRHFVPLADLLRRSGRCDEALSLLEAGLARERDYLGAWVVRGLTLEDAGRHDLARAAWRKVLREDPDNLVALRRLAAWAQAEGDLEGALKHLHRLVAVDPDCAEACRSLQELQNALPPAATADGRPDDAAAPALATLTLVDIYLAQGYRDRALTTLRNLLARHPERTDLQERLLRLEQEEGRSEAVAVAAPRTPVPEITFSDEASRAERARRRAERRAAEKRQFEEWLQRIRVNGGPR